MQKLFWDIFLFSRYYHYNYNYYSSFHVFKADHLSGTCLNRSTWLVIGVKAFYYYYYFNSSGGGEENVDL